MVVIVLLMSAIAISLYNYQKHEITSALAEKIEITESSIARITKNQRRNLISSVKTVANDWGLRRAIGQHDTETIVSALINHKMRVDAQEAVYFGVGGEVVGNNSVVPYKLLEIRDEVVNQGLAEIHRVAHIGDEYYQVVLAEVKAPRRIGWLCMTRRLTELKSTITNASLLNDVRIAVIETGPTPALIFTSYDLSVNEELALLGHDVNIDDLIARYAELYGNTQLNIVVFGSVKDALTGLQQFWRRMIGLFVIIALVALCVTYLMARGITRPLQLLLLTAEKLENGDFSTDIDIDRADEIGDLAVAFRQMQDAVFEREKRIGESLEKLKYQATHDALTGLANRRTLIDELEAANEATKSRSESYNICILDLDRFKVVNDTSGHAAGDALLVKISSILSDAVYSDDVVVRLGGDEFAILLRNCEGSEAVRVCENIRKQIEELVFHWEGSPHRIGVSIGVLPVSETFANTSDIMQRADAGCFIAKENGRNQVYLIEEKSTSVEQKRNELHWVQRLHKAIDNDELILYAQPVVPLNDTAMDSSERVEILVRMRNYETGKMIPPNAFIPSAERYGLNTKIDQWVITQLLKVAPIYKDLFNENRTYWVNLSGGSLCDESFIEFIETEVGKGLLGRGHLNFEITETAIIKNLSEASKMMERLKCLGCRFALDDFGSGLSSFGYLRSLPVDFLKIDGTFVRNILNDNIDRMFVKSIIDIAHAMGIQTVAEFVENQGILDAVKELGADYGQGYELGSPQELLPQVVNQIAV